MRWGGFATVLAATVAIAGLSLAFAASTSAYNAFDWGDGYWGQLGDNCEGPLCAVDRPLSPAGGLTEVAAVSVGGEPSGVHSLAALKNGTVMGWGDNYQGQVGIEPSPPPYGNFVITPVMVPALNEVTTVSAGGEHSLALLKNATVMSWGANESGQLGDGSTTGHFAPAPVSGLTGVSAISAGTNHSLALLKTGAVMAWGANGQGQLGNGTTTGSDVPVAVSGLTGATAVSSSGSAAAPTVPAHGEHSLALLSNGTVMAWGDNDSGQLGNGTTTNSDLPVAVSGLTGVTAVAAGGEHSLALLSNGTVMAWGANGQGQLGIGTTTGSDVPVAVSGLTGVTAVSGGGFYSLALQSNAKLMAWGDNESGELGNGTFTSTDVPVLVGGLNGVAGISAGYDTSLAYGDLTYTPPTITKLKPNTGPVGGGTTVTITGTRFTEVVTVKFGSAKATSFTVNSVTSITAVSPANAAGAREVTVTTKNDGISLPSSADLFKFAPTVTGVSPNGGPQAGGTSVTVTGTGFALGAATKFKFGTYAKSVNCTSTTTCTVISPPHAAGTVDVEATVNKVHSARNRPADQFTYG
jgi:alpha-tubulin suppressor-like RCC1 family protein